MRTQLRRCSDSSPRARGFYGRPTPWVYTTSGPRRQRRSLAVRRVALATESLDVPRQRVPREPRPAAMGPWSRCTPRGAWPSRSEGEPPEARLEIPEGILGEGRAPSPAAAVRAEGHGLGRYLPVPSFGCMDGGNRPDELLTARARELYDAGSEERTWPGAARDATPRAGESARARQPGPHRGLSPFPDGSCDTLPGRTQREESSAAGMSHSGRGPTPRREMRRSLSSESGVVAAPCASSPPWAAPAAQNPPPPCDIEARAKTSARSGPWQTAAAPCAISPCLAY